MNIGMRRYRLVLSLLLVSVLMIGCGGRFWYNQADWLIGWYIDDYIDFHRDQQQHFDGELEELLDWHRENELPRYVELLAHLQTDVTTPMNAGQVKAYADELWSLWQDFMVQALPSMQQILQSLDDAQCRDMLVNIEKKQQKFQEKYADIAAEKLYELRIKRMEKLLRRWVGRLQPDQEAMIAGWADGLPNIYPELIASQQQWAVKVAEALAVRDQGPAFRVALETLFIYPDSLWSDAYRQQSGHNRQLSIQMLVDIQHSLTPEQMQHLQAELEQWRSDFKALAAAS